MTTMEQPGMGDTMRSNGATHRALSDVGAKIIGVNVKKNANMAGTTKPGKATSMPTDPLSTLASRGEVIEPPFDMFTLAALTEHSTELGQCVEAMETNIDGFGHRFISRLLPGQMTDAQRLAIRTEKTRLENFFAYAAGDDDFITFRRKLRKDLETTGNGYFEVIRGASGKIQGFVHLPSYNMRLGRLEDSHFKYERPIIEVANDGTASIVKVATWKRFRKYVQSRAIHSRQLTALGGYKTVWFKEFGDPRVYDNETGVLVPEEKLLDFPESKRANEVVHFRLYAPRTPYGLPRYIGNLISIFGDRAAEEINYTTFKNNNIPSMVVCVSNGALTQGSINRIESFIESQIQGSDNMSKFLLLEAEGAVEGDEGSHVKIDIKPLTNVQHKDALFQNYSEKNHDKIRRVWRLPPIFVGRSDDYTRATAEASRRLADEQVFAPERDKFDAWMTFTLFPDMEIVWHTYRSNTPNTTDNSELVRILSDTEKTGGMTPRIARRMLEGILGQDLPEFPVGFPLDVPFSMTMAEAVKNMASPVEPGQQVTALKSLFDNMYKSAQPPPSSDADEVDRLIRIRKQLEARLQTEVTTLDHDHDDAPDGTS